MAHTTTYPADASVSEVQIRYSKATLGNGAAAMTGHQGDLVSSTRTGTGVHTLVFRHAFPEGLLPCVEVIAGSTVGLKAELTAWNPAAKTATLQLTDAGVAADGNTSDIICFALHVRNSGSNGLIGS